MELKGYVIRRLEYCDFDEIITILTDESELITLLSKGSRKPLSKNGRNLFIGNYCNFEVFLARSKEKISRLKKAISIEEIDWRMEWFTPFNLLNEFVSNYQLFNRDLINVYINLRQLIIDCKYDELSLILIVLEQIIVLNGISIEVNKCIECGNKKIRNLSLKKHGFVCFDHFDPNEIEFTIDECKLIHHLFNHQYEEMNKYHSLMKKMIYILAQYIKDNLGISFVSISQIKA